MEYEKIFGFAFKEWYKDKATVRLAVYMLIIYVFIGLVSLFISAVILAPHITPAMLLGDKAAGSSLDIVKFTQDIIFLVIALLPLSIAGNIVIGYIEARFALRALSLKGHSTAVFSLKKYVRLIGLWIVQPFVAGLSLFNLKFLAIGIIGAVVFAVGAVTTRSGNLGGAVFGWAAIALGLLIYLAYSVIVFYNTIRLSMSSVIFLKEEKGIVESLKGSWELCGGRVLGIFLAFILVWIAVYFLYLALSTLGQGLGFLMFSFMRDIFSLMLVSSIPLFIGYPFIQAIYNYYVVGVYDELVGGPGSAAAKAQAKLKV